MKCFKDLNGIKLIGVVLLALMVLAALFGIKFYNEISSWPLIASVFFLIVSVLVIVFMVYNAIKPGKDESVFERQYRFRFGLNVFSMSLCIILLISVLVSSTVKLNSGEIDAADFYTAFIALCTTFVVGFQIYSSIDLNKKIEKLDKEKNLLEEQLKGLNKISKECEYFNAYTIGLVYYRQVKADIKANSRYNWNALRAYSNALRLAAEGGHDFNETFDAVSEKIQDCMNEIDKIVDMALRDTTKDLGHERSRIKKFINQISMYIGITEEVLKALGNHSKPKSFGDLVEQWNQLRRKTEKYLKKYQQ